MAKHANKQQRNKPNAAPKPVTIKKEKSLNGPHSLWVHLLVVVAISVVVWLCFNTCLQNQLGLWDDTPYIRDNWLVKNISWEGIRNIFSTSCMGNYHPLTILSYAIEYSCVQLEPWLYHFDNLILHIAVVALVYWLVLLLTRRLLAGVVVALLFGLHPMHVESVAWVASRKDLLCALFYFSACIAYVNYLRTGSRKWGWYVLVTVLFLCSLLSKAVAVTLPLSLLLIDHFEGRPVSKRAFLEKIPHFLLALVFGIIAIKVQHSAGAMEMNKVGYSPLERIASGCYALTTYLWKAVVPVQLHCLYPYPNKVNGALPYVYYAYPAMVGIMAYAVWKFLRESRVAIFGAFFFLANILLLLQFLPVGDAIVAERYTYIPYFGLFFIAGHFVSGFFEPGAGKYRYFVSGVVILYVGWLAYASNERCAAWEDEISLWRDETEKEPVTGVRAFNNLGYIYYTKWLSANDEIEKKTFYDSAAYFMNKAILLRPDFVNPYLALGELERNAGRYEEAKNVYFTALERNPKDGNVCFGLAIVNYTMKNMDSAGYYFKKAVEVEPTAQAYGNYANYLTNSDKDDSALVEYNKAVSLTKEDYVPYMNRGNLYKKMNKWNEALQDYEAALKIDPDAGQVYYLRSFCDTQAKNKVQAVADIEKAMSLGYKKVDMGYYNGLKIK